MIIRVVWLWALLGVVIADNSFGARIMPEIPDFTKGGQKNLGPGKPLDFPRGAKDKLMKGLDEGIKAIENATEMPGDLRTIEDYIEKGPQK